MFRFVVIFAAGLAAAGCQSSGQPTARATYPHAVERLDRGAVAGPSTAGGVLVSWRPIAGEATDARYDVFHDGRRLNARPLSGATVFEIDAKRAPRTMAGALRFDGYSVALAGQKPGDAALAAPAGYLSIPLQPPEGGSTPAGETFVYAANDASVGDLDGDGQYEVVLKWDPTNSRDNAHPGYTGPVVIDAYRLNGERLWRIDLGRNVRAGAHYTQFMVIDLDGDGRSEVAFRTSDGLVDGLGKVHGDPAADWRESGGERPQGDRTGAVTRADGTRVAPMAGRIVRGPEFLSVFDGRTGGLLAQAPYAPPRHPDTTDPTPEQSSALWGDGYANRSDRFLAGVAWLDGQLPSLVFARGYYGRSYIAAWDYRNGKLTQRWTFDTATDGNAAFAGQGNHQLSVADVDGDGRQEIIYGAMALDDDGKGLWTSGLLHGDALHVSDFVPSNPGLERWGVQESPQRNGGVGAAMLDARTGKVLWSLPADADVGRGVAFDIDPRHPGAEAWASHRPELFSAAGEVIAKTRPKQVNFGVWWDGDALRELLDGVTISKWDWEAAKVVPLLKADGARANNGTKSTPALSADILGDWREEVLLASEDSRELRVYVTPYATSLRRPSLMTDRTYRAAIAWQNTAYNQPPHLTAGGPD